MDLRIRRTTATPTPNGWLTLWTLVTINSMAPPILQWYLPTCSDHMTIIISRKVMWYLGWFTRYISAKVTPQDTLKSFTVEQYCGFFSTKFLYFLLNFLFFYYHHSFSQPFTVIFFFARFSPRYEGFPNLFANFTLMLPVFVSSWSSTLVVKLPSGVNVTFWR